MRQVCWKKPAANIRTWSAWAYVAFVLDVYSRMIVGWQLATPMRTDLQRDALETALWRRGIKKGLSTGLRRSCVSPGLCSSEAEECEGATGVAGVVAEGGRDVLHSGCPEDSDGEVATGGHRAGRVAGPQL